MQSWQLSDQKPKKIGVLLFEKFSNHCLANAIEPLRAVNTILGHTAYHWDFMTIDGKPVHSSSGLPVVPDMPLSEAKAGDVLLLLPSYGFRNDTSALNLRALRRAAGRFDVVAGLDMGSWLMAAAGILDGYQATIHWDEIDNFAETFPDVDLKRDRFIIDRNRWSCGGGMTAFDLVLWMIANTHGEVIRIEVAALFMFDATANPDGLPPAKSALVSTAVAQMRANIESPLSVLKIAQGFDISLRKLETLFASELGAGPQKIYRHIRLLSARRYVEQTDLSILEISLRCGYENPSAMSRAFKNVFKATPRDVRKERSGPSVVFETNAK